MGDASRHGWFVFNLRRLGLVFCCPVQCSLTNSQLSWNALIPPMDTASSHGRDLAIFRDPDTCQTSVIAGRSGTLNIDFASRQAESFCYLVCPSQPNRNLFLNVVAYQNCGQASYDTSAELSRGFVGCFLKRGLFWLEYSYSLPREVALGAGASGPRQCCLTRALLPMACCYLLKSYLHALLVSKVMMGAM